MLVSCVADISEKHAVSIFRGEICGMRIQLGISTTKSYTATMEVQKTRRCPGGGYTLTAHGGTIINVNSKPLRKLNKLRLNY